MICNDKQGVASDHARSDPAREVHLGIKTGAFYGQEAAPLLLNIHRNLNPN
jgi:hypothetical protein